MFLYRHDRTLQLSFLFLLLLRNMNSTSAQDLFLFSGQSNMLGHPTKNSAEAIEDGRSLFEDTLRLEGSALIDRVDEAQFNALATSPHYDNQTAVRTVEAVSGLRERGVLDGVLKPLPNAYCLWNKATLRPLEAYAGCGSEFGPELTFAHSLQQQASSLYATSQRPLHVRKAAVGGKVLAEFLPGGDMHQLLFDVLDGATPTGIYRAFVWYQGENDVLAETSTQEYVDNFMRLVNLVTLRMYEHGKTAAAFANPADIPVIVVKLAFWPASGTPRRTNIDRAHENVVEQLLSQGRPAALVEGLNRYSRFYHLDPATYLIAGDSIAQVYLNLTYVPPVDCGIFCRAGRFFQKNAELLYGNHG